MTTTFNSYNQEAGITPVYGPGEQAQNVHRMSSTQFPRRSRSSPMQLVPYYATSEEASTLRQGAIPSEVEIVPDLLSLDQCDSSSTASSSAGDNQNHQNVSDANIILTTRTQQHHEDFPPQPSDCPADIVASQKQAWKELQQNSRRSRNSTSAHFSTRIPESSNPSGSDAVHPHKKQMKQARHLKMAVGGIAGATFGTLIGGPIGLIFITPVAIYGSNKLSKKGEKRAQRRWEKANFQRGANDSVVHNAAFA